MNTSPVTRQVPVAPSAYAFDRFLAAETAAWEGRAAELAARGLDYYADDAWWEACEAEPR